METPKDDQNHSKVTITNTICVYPKVLHPPKILNLSNLDTQSPLLMYLVFFYKPSLDLHPDQSLPFNTIFDRLKIGLEETLSEYYPAAGRLRPISGDGRRLELWCNNGGALMAEALTQVKIEELGDLSQYNEFFECLVLKPFVNENDIIEMPLVVAQVTKFGCGGYSIGIGTNHSLFDGAASFNFISTWASQFNNFEENNNNNYYYNKLLLVHERGRLIVTSNNNNKAKNKIKSEGITVDYSNPAINHLYQLIKQAEISTTNDYNYDNKDYYALRTFHINGEMIEKLKKKVYGEENFNSCSNFEILAAHLWKARTKALGVEKEKMVCLQFAVDIRAKMSPPLPKSFTGNAFVLASISSTPSLLEQQSLKSIIHSIKQAKYSITPEYVENYIKALEGPPEYSLLPLKELTMVSDWTRIPFHTVRFMGEDAEYVCPLVPPFPEVAFFMQSPKERKGVDVRIGLFPHFFDNFSQYFLGEFE